MIFSLGTFDFSVVVEQKGLGCIVVRASEWRFKQKIKCEGRSSPSEHPARLGERGVEGEGMRFVGRLY